MRQHWPAAQTVTVPPQDGQVARQACIRGATVRHTVCGIAIEPPGDTDKTKPVAELIGIAKAKKCKSKMACGRTEGVEAPSARGPRCDRNAPQEDKMRAWTPFERPHEAGRWYGIEENAASRSALSRRRRPDGASSRIPSRNIGAKPPRNRASRRFCPPAKAANGPDPRVGARSQTISSDPSLRISRANAATTPPTLRRSSRRGLRALVKTANEADTRAVAKSDTISASKTAGANPADRPRASPTMRAARANPPEARAAGHGRGRGNWKRYERGSSFGSFGRRLALCPPLMLHEAYFTSV